MIFRISLTFDYKILKCRVSYFSRCMIMHFPMLHRYYGMYAVLCERNFHIYVFCYAVCIDKNNYNVKRKLLKYFADCLKCGNFAFAYHKIVE